jgi:hypothetical protein
MTRRVRAVRLRVLTAVLVAVVAALGAGLMWQGVAAASAPAAAGAPTLLHSQISMHVASRIASTAGDVPKAKPSKAGQWAALVVVLVVTVVAVWLIIRRHRRVLKDEQDK